jgi:hypothetical protein
MGKMVRILGATCMVAASVALTPLVAGADISPSSPSTSIEITGAYGGGGNSGPTADFPYDFVELFNAGTTSQSLSGWSLQYLGAVGFAGSSPGNWTYDLPSVTLQPGQHFLWTGYGSGQVSPALPGQEPTGDATDNTSSLDIERYTFSIYLVHGTTPVYSSASSTSATVSVPSGDSVVDELGVGPSLAAGTPRFANTAPVGNPSDSVSSGGGVSNVSAALRTNVCVNTDDNATDFEVVTPSTGNPYPFATMSSPLTPCSPANAAPESPAAVLLPITGAALVGGMGLVFVRRRRHRGIAA